MSKHLFVAAVALTGIMAGCSGQNEHAGYGGMAQGRNLHNSTVREAFDYMTDNSMWSNMAISDIHFVPHTAELSGAGEERLDRMACMLSAYGGTLRYETYSTDQQLALIRMKHVREYLAVAGCDTRRVRIEMNISGGPLTPATDAMRILQEGTTQDEGGGGGSSAGGAGGEEQASTATNS